MQLHDGQKGLHIGITKDPMLNLPQTTIHNQYLPTYVLPWIQRIQGIQNAMDKGNTRFQKSYYMQVMS